MALQHQIAVDEAVQCGTSVRLGCDLLDFAHPILIQEALAVPGIVFLPPQAPDLVIDVMMLGQDLPQFFPSPHASIRQPLITHQEAPPFRIGMFGFVLGEETTTLIKIADHVSPRRETLCTQARMRVTRVGKRRRLPGKELYYCFGSGGVEAAW